MHKEKGEGTRRSIRLAPIRKKGITRLFFSRFFLFVFLILLQFRLVDLFLTGLTEDPLWDSILKILAAGMIFYLFHISMDTTSKLTWMALILMFPLAGTFFLWFTRRDFGVRAFKKETAGMKENTAGMIRTKASILTDDEIISSGTDDLLRYINRTGCFPLFDRSKVVYYPSGEALFEPLLEELRKARRFIFMEFFIIDEGYMWGEILSILKYKAAQGVEVRVMYDGFCELTNLTSDYDKRLAGIGIRAKPFAPLRPVISSHYNYRDHRKIIVIDGRVAMNGGINLADEYINHKKRFGYWKDTAVLVWGEAVKSYTMMFLSMWNLTEKNPEWEPWLSLSGAEPVEGEGGYVLPYSDCPLDEDKVGENVYMDILYHARTYVHIMTPYLILDDELNTAVQYAAKRGVDVRIILPGIPDKKIAYALAKTHYKDLVDAGVRLYEYTPGFVHAKIFVSDDIKAVCGTINMDYRSLYHHFECATYLYKTPCIADMERDFEETLKECREVTHETIAKERSLYRILGLIFKVLAPLM